MAEYAHNYGNVFLNYLPYQSLTYKLLQIVEPQLTANRYEWKDSIDFIVNPQEEYYRAFFTQPWDMEMTRKIFPPRGLFSELQKSVIGMWFILRGELNKLRKEKPLTLEQYKSLENKKEHA